MSLGSASARELVERAMQSEAAGAVAEARHAYERASELDPAYAAPHLNLGLIHLAHRDWGAAERSIREALRLQPEFPEAWVALSEALEETGRQEEALAALERAIAQRSGYSGALFNSAQLLRRLGRDAEAATRMQAFGDAQANEARSLHAQGRGSEAVARLFEALSVVPGHAGMRQALAAVLHGVALNQAAAPERELLASLCADDEISTVFLAPTVLALVKADAAFPSLLAEARAGRDLLESCNAQAVAFMGDRLLLAALPRMAIMDAEIELVLVALRRSLLLRAGAVPAGRPATAERFVCALARQCFYSGYAFPVGPAEWQSHRSLREALRQSLARGMNARSLEATLAIACLYEPLSSLLPAAGVDPNPSEGWGEWFRPIVEEQVLDREIEKGLARKIPALTPIEDPVSLAVRAQYEEHPYPLWASVQRAAPDSIEALAARLRPDRPAIDPRARILIAGCGTGHHPIQVARAFAGSEILAVDLSLASLAYAERMAARFGVRNVRFAQADLLGLGMLDERFAVIESAGVLHHLQDPMRGWRVLAGLLDRGGLMRIALYSERARAGVRAAREHLRTIDLPTGGDGVRRARQAILGLPENHPARDVLLFGDFYTLNGCRDLLLHVQEHTFTLPKIQAALEELGLRFLHMECDMQTRLAFRARFPDPADEASLQAWDRYEQSHPFAFRSMYQFWCASKA